MKIVDGKTIEGVGPHYEQLGIQLSDGSYMLMSYKDLHAILHEFLFEIEVKKTRTWLHPVTPDVDLLYDQERYPDDDDF